MNTGIYPHYFLVPMYIDHWQQVPIYSTYICICLVKLFNDIRWISILICYSDLRYTICITVSILGVEALWSDCKAFLGDQGSKSKVAQRSHFDFSAFELLFEFYSASLHGEIQNRALMRCSQSDFSEQKCFVTDLCLGLVILFALRERFGKQNWYRGSLLLMRFFGTLEKQPCNQSRKPCKWRSDLVLNGQMRVPK